MKAADVTSTHTRFFTVFRALAVEHLVQSLRET